MTLPQWFRYRRDELELSFFFEIQQQHWLTVSVDDKGQFFLLLEGRVDAIFLLYFQIPIVLGLILCGPLTAGILARSLSLLSLN